jgi:hypothetical protein
MSAFVRNLSQVLFCTIPFSVYSILIISLQQHFVVGLHDSIKVVSLAKSFNLPVFYVLHSVY